MEGADSQCPGSGNEARPNDELSFGAKSSVGLFVLGEVAVQKLPEYRTMGDGFVTFVNVLTKLADFVSQILDASAMSTDNKQKVIPFACQLLAGTLVVL